MRFQLIQSNHTVIRNYKKKTLNYNNKLLQDYFIKKFIKLKYFFICIKLGNILWTIEYKFCTGEIKLK